MTSRALFIARWSGLCQPGDNTSRLAESGTSASFAEEIAVCWNAIILLRGCINRRLATCPVRRLFFTLQSGCCVIVGSYNPKTFPLERRQNLLFIKSHFCTLSSIQPEASAQGGIVGKSGNCFRKGRGIVSGDPNSAVLHGMCELGSRCGRSDHWTAAGKYSGQLRRHHQVSHFSALWQKVNVGKIHQFIQAVQSAEEGASEHSEAVH